MLRQLKIGPEITTRDSESLEKYLNEISRIELVSPEEEVRLAKKIKQGDMKALHTLVRANLRFVVSVAKKYQRQGVPLNDLINEGNSGLIKAAERFDETRGFKFISFAVWWIRQSILIAISEQRFLVSTPYNRTAARLKLNKASEIFEQQHDRGPTDEELSEIFEDLDAMDVAALIQEGLPHLSTDAPLDDSSETTRGDLLKGDTEIDQDAFQESLKYDMTIVLKSLKARELEIVTKYFGLNGEPRMSLADIGEHYGRKSERIRQILEAALRRLGNQKNLKLLRQYR